MGEIAISGISIKDFDSQKLYIQRVTNELVSKILCNKLLKVCYFESVSEDDSFSTEGIIVSYGNEVFIIDEGSGYIMKYYPNSRDPLSMYKLSKFNWPSDNIKASRVGLVSDYLMDWFGLETHNYLENPKACMDIIEELSHILKIRYLFSNQDFRLNSEDVEGSGFQDWLIKQPEYLELSCFMNEDWYDNSNITTAPTKADLSKLEKQLDGDNNQNDDTVSGSSEDTIRVYKEFDLGSNDWELDYIFSFKYNSGAYLMKLKTSVLGKIECFLMVLHGTQWVNVQLNDLMLDIRSDCKKDKKVIIETYKKEIINFIDFFEVV